MSSYYKELRGYRPMTHASFALNWALSGERTWSYHLFNFLIHLINSFLVFLLVRHVLRETGREGGPAALAAALVFSLHPIQTSAVTYISGRAAILASAFCLLSLYSFIRYRSDRNTAMGVAAPVFFFFALLAKEMAVSLVALAVLYDLLFTFKEKCGIERLKAGLYHLWFLAGLGVFLATRIALQGHIVAADENCGVGNYLMSEAKALLLYIRLLLLPINQNADYDLPLTERPDLLVAVSAVLILLFILLLWRARKTDPAVTFFGLWSLLALAPESTLIPITDIAVEYRLYLPSAGLFAAAVIALTRALESGRLRKTAAALALSLFIVLTFSRNRVWADEHTLWRDVAAKSPASARSHANYGSALMEKGLYYEALVELNRSLEINPFYEQSYNVHNNVGFCFYRLGMPEEAYGHFERATKVFPGYMEGYENMGAALMELGRYDEAASVLEKAAAIDPAYARVRQRLAQAYEKMGRVADTETER